jgi:hypothetical protein
MNNMPGISGTITFKDTVVLLIKFVNTDKFTFAETVSGKTLTLLSIATNFLFIFIVN